MLVEFTVSNFRSVREPQTLSLVANQKYPDLRGNTLDPEAKGAARRHLLKGVAIYGPNASGKSSVLKALTFMSQFIANSAAHLPGSPTGAVPFAFDETTRDAPSEFEVFFIVGGIMYQYGFAIDPRIVREEYLYSFASGRRTTLYKRARKGDGTYDWSTGKAFRLDAAIRGKVREDNLLLSVGPQFNDAALRPLHAWFAGSVKFLHLGIGTPGPLAPNFTAEMIDKGGTRRDQIVKLLRAADFGVQDARVSHHKFPVSELPMLDQLPTGLADQLKREGFLDALNIQLQHRTLGGEAMGLELQEESDGTQRFFQLVGPWIDVLENNHILLVDELESSLHPMLVQELLNLFFSHPESRAQIVFTTHDPTLLDAGVLRRDQIWFTERNPGCETRLYPLSEYRPRNDEALMKGYLSGRWGALPILEPGLN
ncbi:MAG: AAA family ATPase [Coriobacteriia bacterium]